MMGIPEEGLPEAIIQIAGGKDPPISDAIGVREEGFAPHTELSLGPEGQFAGFHTPGFIGTKIEIDGSPAPGIGKRGIAGVHDIPVAVNIDNLIPRHGEVCDSDRIIAPEVSQVNGPAFGEQMLLQSIEISLLHGETLFPATTEQSMQMISHMRIGYDGHACFSSTDSQIVDGKVIVVGRNIDRFVEMPWRAVMPKTSQPFACVPKPELASRLFVRKR